MGGIEDNFILELNLLIFVYDILGFYGDLKENIDVYKGLVLFC